MARLLLQEWFDFSDYVAGLPASVPHRRLKPYSPDGNHKPSIFQGAAPFGGNNDTMIIIFQK
jgi:hypothetical protein